MKISLSWLKEFIELSETPDKISELLTDSGLEVEGLEEKESVPGGLRGLVIGEVLTCEKHPNADKLSVTTVDIGTEEPSPIVCGAPNVAAGQKVVVATVGAMLYPAEGEPFKIKKAKIRGEASQGMICAEDEIGLGQSHDGIMVLDTDLANGTAASEYFNLESDFVFEIGLTPNRADAASHMGTARDLKALLNRDIQLPKIQLPDSSGSNPIRITIENKEACPRYSGLTIRGVKVDTSPEWLQNRLRAIGINPTNNIVDITNYILHGLGQPMHAFDAAAITGDHVIVKTLPEGSKFTTLDEKKRKLSAKDLMICNEDEGMCIAGVFGGIKSGVTESTTDVFLESAYFSPDWVRKTAQGHQLKTDASFRYERGTDPNITVFALEYAAQLILDIAGGEIHGELIDFYPETIQDFEIEASYSRIDQLIGKNIGKARIKEILESLDISVEDLVEGKFKATVPPFRVDVQREADLVEEVLRIYGLNNIELSDTLSSSYLSEFPQRDSDSIQLELSKILSGSGYNEIVTNSLTKSGYSEDTDSIDAAADVKILNFLSEELNVMRQTMTYSGLEVIERNIKRRLKNLRLYEFGTTYHLQNEKYKEREHLVIYLTGENAEEHWLEKKRPVGFHDLYKTVLQILNKFQISQFETTDDVDSQYAYGLNISTRKKHLLSIGKLSNKTAERSGVNEDVFVADFDWEFLKSLYPIKMKYALLSKFPEVRRDLSLVIDKSVKFEDIRRLSLKLERKLINSLRVFDVYEGDKIGENEKAYAISFFLQDQEKTLTDKIIDKTMSRLIQGFERELKAVIRK